MDDKITIVLLPGLNGTEGLFQPLLNCASEDDDVLTIAYPTHQKLSYSQLVEFVKDKLCALNTPYVLVGESFSGPVALMLGQAKPKNLLGIILVASFVEAPNLNIGRFLPWSLGFALIKPLYTLPLLLTASNGLVRSISAELQKVDPEVLADRMQSIFNVDALHALKNCKVPMVYFRSTKDCMVLKKNIARIIQAKPDITVRHFKTHHFLLQSQPSQAWQAIVEFVQTIAPDGVAGSEADSLTSLL